MFDWIILTSDSGVTFDLCSCSIKGVRSSWGRLMAELLRVLPHPGSPPGLAAPSPRPGWWIHRSIDLSSLPCLPYQALHSLPSLEHWPPPGPWSHLLQSPCPPRPRWTGLGASWGSARFPAHSRGGTGWALSSLPCQTSPWFCELQWQTGLGWCCGSGALPLGLLSKRIIIVPYIFNAPTQWLGESL